jgi:hypothetical protein
MEKSRPYIHLGYFSNLKKMAQHEQFAQSGHPDMCSSIHLKLRKRKRWYFNLTSRWALQIDSADIFEAVTAEKPAATSMYAKTSSLTQY